MGRPEFRRTSPLSPASRKFLDLDEIDTTGYEVSRKRRSSISHISVLKRARVDTLNPRGFFGTICSKLRTFYNYWVPSERPSIMDDGFASTSQQADLLERSEEEGTDEIVILEQVEVASNIEKRFSLNRDDVIFLGQHRRSSGSDIQIIEPPQSVTEETLSTSALPALRPGSSHHKKEKPSGRVNHEESSSSRLQYPILNNVHSRNVEVITISDTPKTSKNRLPDSPKSSIDKKSFDAYKKLLVNDLKLVSESKVVPYSVTPLSQTTSRAGLFKRKSLASKGTGAHLQRVYRAIHDKRDDEITIIEPKHVSKFLTPAPPRSRSDSSSTLSSTAKSLAQYFEEVENKFTQLPFNSAAIVSKFEKSSLQRKEQDLVRNAELEHIKTVRNEGRKDQNVVDEMRTKLKISGIKIPPVERERKRLIDLPTETDELLSRVWNSGLKQTEVLAKCQGAEITRKDLLTLRAGQWLNDEVINAFLGLIVARSEKSSKYPKAYTFNTFFYKNIRDPGKGYKSVARWTRKVDIFSKEIILVPVHLEVHWCMAVIDMIEQKIEYYDSMAGYSNGDECLMLLLDYLVNEAENKKKNFEAKEWRKIIGGKIPQQQNGYDCGVFSCLFAEYASRRAEFTFTQADINYYRKRMVWEICNDTLLND